MDTELQRTSLTSAQLAEIHQPDLPVEDAMVLAALGAAVEGRDRQSEVVQVYQDAQALGVPASRIRILHMFARANTN